MMWTDEQIRNFITAFNGNPDDFEELKAVIEANSKPILGEPSTWWDDAEKAAEKYWRSKARRESKR